MGTTANGQAGNTGTGLLNGIPIAVKCSEASTAPSKRVPTVPPHRVALRPAEVSNWLRRP